MPIRFETASADRFPFAVIIASAMLAAGANVALAQPGLPALSPPQTTRGGPPVLPNLETIPTPDPTPKMGSGQLVADVQLRGIPEKRHYEAQKYLRTRKDREFDPEMLQDDVRRLMSSGLYTNVKTYTSNGPQGVIITFEISERARIREVKFIGNRGFSDKSLLKETSLKVGDPFNQFTIEEGRRKIEEKYHGKGYPKATVTLWEGDRPSDRDVVYYINEGNLERIANVSFEGNTIATDARLKTQIESKPGYFWYFFRGKLERKKIDEDIEKLTAYYRSLGFFRARIGRELEFDDTGKWVNLKFVIDEGPRYIVRNITIEGNEKFASGPLLNEMHLKSGEFFDQGKLRRDVEKVLDVYGSQGHVFADVNADLRFLEEPGHVDVIHRIKEGDVFTVGKVNVHIASGHSTDAYTQQRVVLNRLSFRTGDLIDIREIRNSERRLKAAQVFSTNPQDGEPPRIVVQPPSLASESGDSNRRAPKMRGQSPDEPPPAANLPPASPPLRETVPLRTGTSLYHW